MFIYRRGGKATEVAACVGCHGERGHGTESLPRLAGQVASYLATQLKNFGTRERTNDNAVMHTIAARMTEEEIVAVAEYLSGLE
jgi:cytochrome c553